MRLRQLFNKTRRGETLTEKEVDILASKLQLNESFSSLGLKILLSIVVVLLVITGLICINYIIFQVIIVILGLSLIIFIFVKKNKKPVIKYLEILKDFYIDRLCEYEGFENMLVQHQYMKNGYLQNNLAIFATDGYVFYIFDDFLKETRYLLPAQFKGPNNKRPALKIFNQEFVRKRPVCFEVNEINYFELYDPKLPDIKENESYGCIYRRYTYTITNNILDNYCLLVLNDGSTFKLAPEAVILLRKKASKKERMGD